MIQCPRCGAPVVRPTESGSHIMGCGSCQARFHVFTGQLASVNSRRRDRRSPDAEALHRLTIALANGRRVVASFRAARDAVPAEHVRSGDEVTFVYAVRGPGSLMREEQVVHIVDHTTGRRYSLLPGRLTPSSSYLHPILALGLSMLLLALVFATNERIGGMLALPGILAAVFGLHRLSARLPDVPRLAAATEDELGDGSDTLLAQLRELQAGREACRLAIAAHEARVAPLHALRDKMERVGRDKYASRLDTLTRAIDLLSTQRDVQQQLLNGYERAIAMIEIEVESGAVGDALDDGIVEEIESGRSELDALREQSAEIERLVAANDEVSRLLRPGGGA
jgi:hypothetical protein